MVNEKLLKQAREIVKNMTLEEKIGQLVQYGKLKERQWDLVKKGQIGSFLNVSGAKNINELQREILNSDCKIPLIIGDDVIHGYKTIFPIPLALSCSFDLELIEETCAISSEEASSEGINMIFAPMIDIARDPRWGRVAEGAGEDPYIGSEIAKARVRGYQRNNWNDRPFVTACAKHYIAYGAAEGGRDYNGADVSERTIREVYLPPFKAAIEEGCGSIMCSFNDLNGEPLSGNEYMLRKVLRDELNFKGVVVSDWESVEELIDHGFAEDKKEAAYKGIKAGVDIDMNSGTYEENLYNLVKEGLVDEALIDEAAERIIALKLALNLFNISEIDEKLSEKVIRNKKYIDVALEAAKKSIVLLKNDGILPLSKNIKSIALIGPLVDDKVNPLGCWVCKGDPKNVVTVLEGIKSKLSEDVDINYSKGCEILEEIDGGIEEAKKVAKDSEVVVMVLGEAGNMSGENNNRAYLDIPKPQKMLLEEILKVNKRVVLVLMNGRPLTLEWEDKHLPAIVEAWHLGEQSGNAIADILFGDFNPSGKLTITFPRCVGQIPIYYNHKNTGRPTFKKYLDVEETPLYPFGYGLSYTRFEYFDLELSKEEIKLGEKITAKVKIKNVGDREGEEIVQLYIRDISASITRPVKELKGFKKISLKPGEVKEVEFEIGEKELALLDKDYNFVVEPGTFKICIGPNSVEGLEKELKVVK